MMPTTRNNIVQLTRVIADRSMPTIRNDIRSKTRLVKPVKSQHAFTFALRSTFAHGKVMPITKIRQRPCGIAPPDGKKIQILSTLDLDSTG